MSNLYNGRIFSTSLLSGGLSYWYSIKEKILEYDTLNKCHNDKNSFFINYDDNLYDITKFINKTPGDPSKISFVTGKILENYWKKSFITLDSNLKSKYIENSSYRTNYTNYTNFKNYTNYYNDFFAKSNKFNSNDTKIIKNHIS